jgi:uncharacterized membrane-anchored protein
VQIWRSLAIEARMAQVISMVEFNSGNRYADFTPGTDKVAEYGLAALVLEGVAAKVGLFKGLIALLLAGKKFIILAVVAVGGFFTKMFRRKKRMIRPSVIGIRKFNRIVGRYPGGQASGRPPSK